MFNQSLVAIALHKLGRGDTVTVLSGCCQKTNAYAFVVGGKNQIGFSNNPILPGKIFTKRSLPTICGFTNSFAAANGMVYGGVSLASFPLTDMGGGIGFYLFDSGWIEAFRKAGYEPKPIRSREAFNLFSSPDYGKTFDFCEFPKLFHLPGKSTTDVERIVCSVSSEFQVLPDCRVVLKPEQVYFQGNIAA